MPAEGEENDGPAEKKEEEAVEGSTVETQNRAYAFIALAEEFPDDAGDGVKTQKFAGQLPGADLGDPAFPEAQL